MKRSSPLLVLLLACVSALAQLPNQWTKLVTPAALTANGHNAVSMYVTRNGQYTFFDSTNGVFRVKTSEVEANPGNPAAWPSWTAMNMTGWPTELTYGGYQQINTWGENPVNGDVLAYTGYTSGGGGTNTCGSGPTACQIATIHPATLTWSLSTTQFTGMITGIVVDPANGYMYASSLNPQHIYRSTDSGKTWPVLYATPYTTLAGQSVNGYIYGLAMFGNNFYWGGEGPNVTSSSNFATNSVDITTAANGYKRNSGWFASDAWERGTPHYIIACCRNQNGYNFQRWDASTGKWTQLTNANGFVQYGGEVSAIGPGVVHGNAVDEFYGVVNPTNNVSYIYFTKGSTALHWNVMNTTGLPAFNSTVKPHYPVINHASYGSCSLYVWIQGTFYVHPCM